MSLRVADVLDRKEMNVLNYRTKAVYVSSRREITGVNSLHNCTCTPRVSLLVQLSNVPYPNASLSWVPQGQGTTFDIRILLDLSSGLPRTIRT
jgi:hypothetical protein